MKKMDFFVHIHILFEKPAKVVSWNAGAFKNK